MRLLFLTGKIAYKPVLRSWPDLNTNKGRGKLFILFRR